MLKRVVTSLVLAAIGIPAIIFGGVFYFVVMAFFVTVAAWEYSQMFRSAGYNPARTLIVGGVFSMLVTRAFFPDFAADVFSIGVLAALVFHLYRYEKGRDQAPVDFAITLGGLAYLGWIGAYLMDLRFLPDGGWWFMLVLPTVMMADTGAYMIGAKYGAHKMTPRLSPKKSWEGFWAGIFSGVLFGGFFAWAYSTWGPLHVAIWQGALLGLILGALTPLGDLGESMIKRQANLKDSSELFPGHGGAFDRIDSWLWAGVIGYYLITWFLI
jgi:phosphatidate cytidylyltransferase